MEFYRSINLERETLLSSLNFRVPPRTRNFQVRLTKTWQNQETCFQKDLQPTHTSSMCPSFAKSEALFPAAKYFLLHGRNIFPCGKTGKHWGNMCPRQMFLATYFLVLPDFKPWPNEQTCFTNSCYGDMFPNVYQFCRTGNVVSGNRYVSA